MKTAKYYLSRFASNLGRMPIGEITPPDVLAVLRVWEKQGKHETAKRLLQLASRIFRYAMATANEAAAHLRKAGHPSP